MIQLDKEGFPIWGNPSPQKPGTIPGRQITMMVEDTRINQVFNGNAEEIRIIQKVASRQPRAEGYQAGSLVEVGKFGSSLFDTFMQPYNPAADMVTP